MTTKKKKGMNIELNDFDFDEQDVARMQQERAGAADRVAKFTKDFEPTGSAFKDTNLLSGTSRDVKTMRTMDALLDKAADRAATVRAQDAGLEVERGKIGIDKTRNTLFRRQLDNQMELGVGDLTLRKGALDIDRAILGMQKDRYNNVTKPSDMMSLAERAVTTRVGIEEAGFELSDDLFAETSRYLKEDKPAEADSVAMPTNTPAPAPEVPEFENISRASVIGQYIKAGTGLPNPLSETMTALKEGSLS